VFFAEEESRKYEKNTSFFYDSVGFFTIIGFFTIFYQKRSSLSVWGIIISGKSSKNNRLSALLYTIFIGVSVF